MSRLTGLRGHVPSLATLGIGVQYFPGYVHRRVHLHSLDVVLLTVVLRGHGQHLIDQDCFVETGASVAVTHLGQQHDLLTDDDGMDVLNVYLDLERHTLPVLPRELQPVLPLFLPHSPLRTPLPVKASPAQPGCSLLT